MLSFQVPDMTCGHCAGAITKAVKALDPAAKVDIDLAQHLVRIDTQAEPAALEQAIRAEGYTPSAAAA